MNQASSNGAPSAHHEILVLGGGSAGLSVAARLMKQSQKPDVAVVDPATKHYYQPLWTLVGGGDAKLSQTVRDEAAVMPKGVTWIQEAVTRILPDEKVVETSAGRRIGYDFLVVALGIELDWEAVDGLAGNVGKDGICSNYSADTVEYTWTTIQAVKSGTAVFTHPNTPIKCGGAPQKIMYLAAHYWQKHGLLDKIGVHFRIATPTIFSVPHYAAELVEVADSFGIDVRYQKNLVAVRPEAREAVFQDLAGGDEEVIKYDMLHVTPPQTAPDVVKTEPPRRRRGMGRRGQVHAPSRPLPGRLLPRRLQQPADLEDRRGHPRTGTGPRREPGGGDGRKTASEAVRRLHVLPAGDRLRPPDSLAEFDYDKKRKETFPFDQSKQRWSMYVLKKVVLPQLYWNGMLKGRA